MFPDEFLKRVDSLDISELMAADRIAAEEMDPTVGRMKHGTVNDDDTGPA